MIGCETSFDLRFSWQWLWHLVPCGAWGRVVCI